MCGAAVMRDDMNACVRGLSPRVRGSPSLPFSTFLLTRSIPTCAGQPKRNAPRPIFSQVYPHVCGAAKSMLVQAGQPYGLSPRVRGSLRVGFIAYTFQRSIPTCAGQPIASAAFAFGIRVYPHVCGAAIYVLLYIVAGIGLSPRVRGSQCTGCISNRSIPTCAGQPLDELMLGTPTYPSGEYSNCISPNARRPRQRCSSALHPAS